MNTRVCSKCGIEKPLDEYHKNRSKPHGRRYDCKSCCKEQKAMYYKTNTEKVKERNRNWRNTNIKKAKAVQRAHKYRHCINFEDVMLRYDDATNCECCGREFCPDSMGTTKCIDHSGDLIRGIICDRCNRGMGYFGDTLAGVKNAVTYLERTV